MGYREAESRGIRGKGGGGGLRIEADKSEVRSGSWCQEWRFNRWIPAACCNVVRDNMPVVSPDPLSQEDLRSVLEQKLVAGSGRNLMPRHP